MEADSSFREAILAVNSVSLALLEAIHSVSGHLEYWESLERKSARRKLTAVLVRRGPLPFLRSLGILVASQLPLGALPSLPTLIQRIPKAAAALYAVGRAACFVSSAAASLASAIASVLPLRRRHVASRIHVVSRDQHESEAPGSSSAAEQSAQGSAAHQSQRGSAAEQSFRRGMGAATRGGREESELQAAAFVQERVALLRGLRKRLLTALGEVWAAMSVEGKPPPLAFSPLGGGSGADVAVPEGFDPKSALALCYKAISGLQGPYGLPQERHGPFENSLSASLPGSTARGRVRQHSLMLLFSDAPNLLHWHRSGSGSGSGATAASTAGEEHPQGAQLQLQVEVALTQHARELRLFTSMILAHYGRPGRAAQQWLEIAAVGLGTALATAWVGKRRGDLVRWFVVARDAAMTFAREHIVQPLVAVRDDIFVTFRPQKTSIVSLEDVRVTADSLHRMLMAYVGSTSSELGTMKTIGRLEGSSGGARQAQGRESTSSDGGSSTSIESVGTTVDLPVTITSPANTTTNGGSSSSSSSSSSSNTSGGPGIGGGVPTESVALERQQEVDPSTAELMAVLMKSYEKEVTRPLQGLVTGHLARALLIQVQQMKLHVESALLEMEKILRANEINFAFLAALPALALFLGASSLATSWLANPSRGEMGRGRVAQTARRMLLGEVELLVLRHLDDDTWRERVQGSHHSTRAVYGELIYRLYLLHSGSKRGAKRSGEWTNVERDIAEASRLDMGGQAKALLMARMGRLYECFATKEQRLLHMQ